MQKMTKKFQNVGRNKIINNLKSVKVGIAV